MKTSTTYSQGKLQDSNSHIWDIFSLSSILLCLFVFLIQWRQLPFFLDMYYHLAVAKGFEVAGGIVGHNFWEYGPEGVPHLYPPLIHLLILGLLKTGLSPIATLRLLSSLMPAALLLTLWHTIRELINRRTAFFVVFLALCPSLFLISISFTPAATLGIIFLLLGMLSIYKKRIMSAVLFFGLIFYTHIGVSILAMVFILAWGISFRFFARLRLAQNDRGICLGNTLMLFLAPLLIGSPWIFHIIKNLSQISWQNTAHMSVRFYPVLLAFFIVGVATRGPINWATTSDIRGTGHGARGTKTLLLLLFVSLTPIGLFYPFRYLCAQGMVGFLVFAGIGLERSYSLINASMQNRRITRKYTGFVLVILLLYLIFFAPSIIAPSPISLPAICRRGLNPAYGWGGEGGVRGINLKISDSLLTSLFEGKEMDRQNLLSTGIFSKDLFETLIESVEEYSEEGEFIWSNYRYAIAGILWAMTERPSLSSMLIEVQDKKVLPNINNAKLLIIMDEPNGEFKKIYNRTKGRFKVVGVKKIEGISFYILSNRVSSLVSKYKIPSPLLSSPFAYALLGIYLFSLMRSFKKVGEV